MILSVLPVLFMFSAEPRTTSQPAQQPAPAATEAPAAEPKMICKFEQVTGSRLQKTKVCRPEGQSGNDQSTALQRSLDKVDSRPIETPSFGN
jgi:hypothetical protein